MIGEKESFKLHKIRCWLNGRHGAENCKMNVFENMDSLIIKKIKQKDGKKIKLVEEQHGIKGQSIRKGKEENQWILNPS